VTYVINAGQFVLKLRAARMQAAKEGEQSLTQHGSMTVAGSLAK
jgi:hypothetical protein